MDVHSLDRIAADLHEEALEAPSGRAARTLCGGSGRLLRQTLLALTAGTELAEHANPGEATLHVLSGRVELHAGDLRAEACAGQLLDIPDRRHSLVALEDSVVLLTVARHA